MYIGHNAAILIITNPAMIDMNKCENGWEARFSKNCVVAQIIAKLQPIKRIFCSAKEESVGSVTAAFLYIAEQLTISSVCPADESQPAQ